MARSSEKQTFAFTGLGSADDPSDIVVACQLHPRQPHGIRPDPSHWDRDQPDANRPSSYRRGCCAVLRPHARVAQESVEQDEVVVARHDEVVLQGNLHEPSAR